MAPDCYAVAKHFATCASSRVLLKRNITPIKLFPAPAPREIVSIDLVRELLTTRRFNRFLLFITDSFPKLTKTVLPNSITAHSVA